MAQWIKSAGKKEHGHHQNIRGEVKTLHVFDHRTQRHSKRGERYSVHGYEGEGRHEVDPVLWPKARKNAHQKNQCSLEDAYGCSAERASYHEINSRTGATRVSLRNPNWRSQSTAMPENIELRSTVMPTTPG